MSSAHCFLRIENQNICHGIVRFLISHIFQHKRYISIARIGNFIMYVLGPFSRKESVYIPFQNGLELTCSLVKSLLLPY